MALTGRAITHRRRALASSPVVRDGVAPRVLRVLFVAYVVATAVHIGLVMAHEPFAFDAWNIAVDTRAEPFTFGRFLDYGLFEYTHSNPRIGQWLTYLAYKLEYFAPIATPIAYLGLALAVTVLGLGRFPGGRRAGGGRTVGRDLALAAIAIGVRLVRDPADRHDHVLPRVRRELPVRRGDPAVVPGPAAAGRAAAAAPHGTPRGPRARVRRVLRARGRRRHVQRAHRARRWCCSWSGYAVLAAAP